MSKSKSADAQASKAVLEYLARQNRPYSANDIFNNLHKDVGKTAVTRALESLASEGKIVEKTYGKQKIYFADQSQFVEVKDEELKAMDAQILNMSGTLKELQDNIKQKEKILSTLNSSLTTDEMKAEIKTLTKEVKKLQVKVEALTSNGVQISQQEKETINANYDRNVKEWRKRKRMATEMVDAILEGYPKGKKVLFEEIGLETDEDVKVAIPS